MTKLFQVFAFLFVVTIQVKAQDSIPRFKNGETVCFIGNSITHGGSYHTLVQLFCATRFPEAKVSYFNCGISGDNASGMLRRLDSDILIHKPSHAFLMTGMNDVLSSLYSKEVADSAQLIKRQQALDTYFKLTEKLAKRLVDKKIKPIFMTPTIYDQVVKVKAENHYGTNEALAICATHIRQLAAKYNAPVVDLYKTLNTLNAQQQANDSSYTIIGKDRVHPTTPGHLVMGYEIIKTILPSEHISIMRLHAKKNRVLAAKNCSIQIGTNQPELTFEVLEYALPFPVKEALQSTLDLIPDHKKYNREILQVKKLKRGEYQLYIDDTAIATFSHKALKKGINLAYYRNTPQYKQAEEVSKLCFNYKDLQSQLRTIRLIEYKSLKDYKGDGSIADKKQYLHQKCESQKGKSWYPYMVKTSKEYFELLPLEGSLKNNIQVTRNQIYTANTPKWHTYKLVKLTK